MKQSRTHRVIVQIVTHNSEGVIGACIRSLSRQTYRRFRIIVIDNASTDRTRLILDRLKIPYIRNVRNDGYASAHNVALRMGRSAYVMTVNPDVELSPDCIRILVRTMDARTGAGSAQPLLYRSDRVGSHTKIIDSAGLYMTPYRRQKLRYSGSTLNEVSGSACHIFGPDGAAAFYRRKMLSDIDLGNGVFDESFFMHKEDVDVCWRAQLRGWYSVFVPDAVGYHIRTFRAGIRTGIDASMRVWSLRNRYLMMLKNDMLPLLLRDIVWILAYDIGILFFVIVREQASLPAYFGVLCLVPSMLRARKKIQKSRRAGVLAMSRWFVWREI